MPVGGAPGKLMFSSVPAGSGTLPRSAVRRAVKLAAAVKSKSVVLRKSNLERV